MTDRPEWVQRMYEAETRFWANDYVVMSREQKIVFWSSFIHKGMRDERNDPYALYTEAWLAHCLEREPLFMELLPAVLSKWSIMWDKEKVNQLIQVLYTKNKTN